MDDFKIQHMFTRFSWRWLFVSFCFLILFHLVPTYFSIGLPTLMYRRALGPLVLWLGLGVALVGAYVGYRSKGFTLLEPALAAVIYSLLFVLKYKPLLGRYFFAYYPTTRTAISLVLLAFISGLAGAVIGELLQMQKERRLMPVREGSGSQGGS